ncbi:heparinase II/III domain-containing protein [Chondrinema litorale]|uniref:heparinase II/III domain-containing protein n=1 Tax=Chondrinema litorale TaxID=2994555 RepID=UPI002543413F|nr:heparinase II/III family protein [Chondrinema litorale]UZR95665.1 heparinase II/III family protein [Chondrinema litorale]
MKLPSYLKRHYYSFQLIQILILFYPTINAIAQSQTDQWLISKYYSENVLNEILIPVEEWQPFPKDASVYKEALSEEAYNTLIKKGEEALEFAWPSLTASQLLEYHKTGNRRNYEKKYFDRRYNLRDLVLAELLEAKGRFTEEIVNGIWLICDESYWGLPAHLYLQKGNAELPNVLEPTVDLFAAQTANLLAWTDYLLGEKLDVVSPRIRERIKIETERRILEPTLKRDDFWWMGFSESQHQVNNWNPWIASNWLAAVLLLEDNKEERAAAVFKIMKALDNFLNPYPRDGGCDEGPSYWGRAGASLFDCLELLNSATDGKINIYDQEIIKNIGTYIYKAYIGDNYFINFADAAASMNPSSDLIFRYGKRINDVQMQQFGAYMAKKEGEFATDVSLDRALFALLNYKNLYESETKFNFPKDVWLPESEIMAARSNSNNTGFYIAAKGGHNNESHNHNDVGNFIIYYNAKPVLVDAGVGTYTAKTFSNQRYTIWNMQSAYHNLPTVNGVMEKEGRKFEADEVNYRHNSRMAKFSLDLAKTYPEEAQIKSWKRTIQLNRGKNVTLSERFVLNKVTDTTFLSLITPCEVRLTEPGEIRLVYNEAGTKFSVYINYNPELFKVEKEAINLEGDENGRLKSTWANGLNRIKLIDKLKQPTGNWKFLISSY